MVNGEHDYMFNFILVYPSGKDLGSPYLRIKHTSFTEDRLWSKKVGVVLTVIRQIYVLTTLCAY